jgi:hypothetical protein
LGRFSIDAASATVKIGVLVWFLDVLLHSKIGMNKEQFERTEKAISLAIAHVIANGTDDIFCSPVFSDAFELDVMRRHKEAFEKKAYSETLSFIRAANLGRERIGQIYRCLIIKDENSFRNVHWIDPFDIVKYLALSILLFDRIEAARPSREAGIVHSHRRCEDGITIFDPAFNYKSFREKSGALSRQKIGQWKVVADISVFFDRIGNHQLENHLLDLNCDPTYVLLMRDILLFWAENRRSYGIPVGCDASRIISEAALVSVDRQLSALGITYIRFVDDFRLFANSRAEAYENLRQLTDLLTAEGLHINNKKTSVAKIVAEDGHVTKPEIAPNDVHEVINEKERVIEKKRIRVSGRSVLSRRYVEPGKDAIANLKKMTKDGVIERYKNCSIGEKQDVLRLVVKYFIYVDNDVSLIDMVIDEQMTSIVYVVDALTKEQDKLDSAVRSTLKENIFIAMGGVKCSYPIGVSLIKLFSSAGYEDGRFVNYVVGNAKLIDNQVFLRYAIFLGFQQLDMFHMRKLAVEVFSVVPPLTQRAIYYALRKYNRISEDARRPLLRNLLQSSTDWFIEQDARA